MVDSVRQVESMQSRLLEYLPQLTPFIVGLVGFAAGLVIAFRQHNLRKRATAAPRDRAVA